MAGGLLGWRPVCAVEWNEYAASVLVQRQNERNLPPFPIWDDIRAFDGLAWRGSVDVVTGGFPCQAFSTAARGANNAEDLWPEMRRVVADVAPWCVFAENVAERAIDHAADDLEAMGYEVRAIALSAKDLGADHIRPRYWLLAYAHGYRELLRAEYAKASLRPIVPAGVWASDPGVARIPDGVAHRMERVRATGNGQCPVVAARAWLELAGSI